MTDPRPGDCCPWDSVAARLTPAQRRCVRLIEIGLVVVTIALLVVALSYARDAVEAAGIALLILGGREGARFLLVRCIRPKR